MTGSSEENVDEVYVGDIQFLENNKKIFTFFKYAGMYLVKQDGKQIRVSFGRLILSELLWMLWHLIGLVLTVMVWRNSGDSEDDESNYTKLCFRIFTGLIFYLFIGPIQSSILRKTMEAFPAILKNIKDLEDMNFESKVKSRYKKIRASKIILRKRDEYEAQQQSDQLDEMEQVSEKSERKRTLTLSTKILKKVYKIISKLWVIIIIILGVMAFVIVCYNAMTTDEIKDEGKLVLMCFCIIFPIITTWFCLVLIEHHRNMYKVLLRLKDEAFIDKETNILKEIGTYINTLQALFERLSDNIFSFTLGMNFAIFTIIGTTSTYEILQQMHIFHKAGNTEEFEDIVYVFPLAISILHIYLVCKRTHDLKHGGYDHLKIRMKKMLPDLITSDDKDKEKTFKKVETLYKNLKDAPPHVSIYGGFKINYKILVGMCFFFFAYAKSFDKINKPGYSKGYSKDKYKVQKQDTHNNIGEVLINQANITEKLISKGLPTFAVQNSSSEDSSKVKENTPITTTSASIITSLPTIPSSSISPTTATSTSSLHLNLSNSTTPTTTTTLPSTSREEKGLGFEDDMDMEMDMEMVTEMGGLEEEGEKEVESDVVTSKST